MGWERFRITGPFWGESIGHRWIHINAELRCFLWCMPERYWITVELLGIWYATTIMVNSVAAFDLATQGARAPAAMILIFFYRNIPVSMPEGLNLFWHESHCNSTFENRDPAGFLSRGTRSLSEVQLLQKRYRMCAYFIKQYVVTSFHLKMCEVYLIRSKERYEK